MNSDLSYLVKFTGLDVFRVAWACQRRTIYEGGRRGQVLERSQISEAQTDRHAGDLLQMIQVATLPTNSDAHIHTIGLVWYTIAQSCDVVLVHKAGQFRSRKYSD